MKRSKKMREKGKIRLSKYFQKFEEGDKVTVVKDAGEMSSFPETLQGRTGKIETKRGKAYIVKIFDKNQEKRYIIHPVHLKRLI